MRNGLYMYRHRKRLSQQQMADQIGCNRATYAAIEAGKRDGRVAFWNALQTAFDIPDADIGGLMRNDKEQTENDRASD